MVVVVVVVVGAGPGVSGASVQLSGMEAPDVVASGSVMGISTELSVSEASTNRVVGAALNVI